LVGEPIEAFGAAATVYSTSVLVACPSQEMAVTVRVCGPTVEVSSSVGEKVLFWSQQ